jgi:glyoxylase I family protein
MNVTRILHASVNAAGGLEETTRFYAEVLGLLPAPRPEIPGVPGAWFRAGEGEVHVIGAPCRGEGIDPTGHHYCLAVEDLDAAVGELEAKGVPYVRAGQGSVVQVFLTDPAGNTIELQQDRELESASGR